MHDVFHSRSATLASPKTVAQIKANEIVKSEIVYTRLDDSVFWFGPIQSPLVEYGRKLGISIISFNELLKDASILTKSRMLVFNDVPETNFKIQLKMASFASNYNVPVIWIHSQVIPHRWIWTFQRVYVGNISPEYFWSDVFKAVWL